MDEATHVTEVDMRLLDPENMLLALCFLSFFLSISFVSSSNFHLLLLYLYFLSTFIVVVMIFSLQLLVLKVFTWLCTNMCSIIATL